MASQPAPATQPTTLGEDVWARLYAVACAGTPRPEGPLDAWMDRIDTTAAALAQRLVARARQPVEQISWWTGTVTAVDDPYTASNGTVLEAARIAIDPEQNVRHAEYGYVDRNTDDGRSIIAQAKQLLGQRVRYAKVSRVRGGSTHPYITAISPAGGGGRQHTQPQQGAPRSADRQGAPAAATVSQMPAGRQAAAPTEAQAQAQIPRTGVALIEAAGRIGVTREQVIATVNDVLGEPGRSRTPDEIRRVWTEIQRRHGSALRQQVVI